MSRVYALTRIKKMVGEGVSGSHWLELAAVGKRQSGSRYTIANEFICAKLATAIGLPIPPFALLQAKNGTPEVWFGSIDYCLTGESLPPIDPEVCIEKFPFLSAGIICFDVWIGNTDRHTGNLNMDISHGKPPRLNVFDHGHAMFSFEGASRLASLVDKFAITESAESGANRHCLLDVLKTDDDLGEWCERISLIPEFLIREACDATVEAQLLTREEGDAALTFLLRRREKLRQFLWENRTEFQSILTWSLFWSTATNESVWDGPHI